MTGKAWPVSPGLVDVIEPRVGHRRPCDDNRAGSLGHVDAVGHIADRRGLALLSGGLIEGGNLVGVSGRQGRRAVARIRLHRGGDRAAERRGFEIVGVYKEKASGAKTDRIERKKVMALAQAREIDAILVTELSRWGRSTIDLVQTLQSLQAWDVSVLAVSG